MKTRDYTVTIKTKGTAKDAFQKIAKVGNWWAKDFKGKALRTGDTFTVRFGETHVDFKITEAIPDKYIVWQVTGCYLHWLNNKTEWNDTRIVWEISEENKITQIKMTHIGLTPDVECYEDCKVGWTGHVTKSLVSLINENKGQPE